MKVPYKCLILMMLAGSVCELFGQQNLQFVTDFPGGNITIDRVSHDTVYLSPDLRDTEGYWFYWYFGLKGAAGKDLVFQFKDKRSLAAFGPAVSLDQGKTWKWLFDKPLGRSSFAYMVPANSSEVRFSMGMPYTQSNFEMFMNQHKKNPFVQVGTLCTSEKGRAVEKISIRNPSGKAPLHKVLITARHHACEMMANYELEGIIEAVLSRGKNMKWLRENVEFMIVPFMDKDGVEDGDQGKNRRPRDHNRDYSDKSIYAATATLRREIPGWADGKLKIGLDLHCPGLNGKDHESIHLVGSSNAEFAASQRKFSGILEKHVKGELAFKEGSNFLPYGTSWNKASNTSQGMSFGQWVSTMEGIVLPMTIEFPYAITNGQMITPKNSRAFGNDVAQAIFIYLQQLDPIK